jgi:hypothetical protein
MCPEKWWESGWTLRRGESPRDSRRVPPRAREESHDHATPTGDRGRNLREDYEPANWSLRAAMTTPPKRTFHFLDIDQRGAFQPANHGTRTHAHWDATGGEPKGNKAFPEGAQLNRISRDRVSSTGNHGSGVRIPSAPPEDNR